MKASQVVSSVVFNYLSLIFITATGFFYTSFVLHHLSHPNYGILALVSSLLLYAGLLNLGVGPTVMKMVAERAENDPANEIPRIVGNALILFGVASIIAVVAILALEPFVGPVFHLKGTGAHTLRVALVISTPGLAVILPSAMYTGVHQAYHDYRYIAMLSIVTQAGSVIAGVVLLLFGFGVISLVVVATAQTVIIFLAKAIHARTKFGLRPELKRVDWHLGRQMLATSVWVLLLNIAAQAIYSSDVVVVGAVLGTAAAASYQVALSPAIGIKNISDQFAAVSLTAATSLKVREEFDEVRRLLTEATRVVVATAGPGVVVFSLWGRRLIELWAGRSYLPAYPTLVVLSFALLAAALQSTSAQLLFALNHYRRLALLALLEAAVNVGLSIFLARRIGIVGVAWGTAIPITVMTVGFYVPMACRLIGLRYIELLRRLILPIALNGAAYLILGPLSHNGSVFPNIIALLSAAVAVFALCFSLSILLDRRERDTYIDMVRTAAARLRS